MIDYRQYKSEDFASDESFRNWQLHQLPEATAFWENWRQENVDNKDEVQKAIQLLEAVATVYNHVTDKELRSEMSILAERAKQRSIHKKNKVWSLTFLGVKLFRVAASIGLVFGVIFWMYIQKYENKINPVIATSVAPTRIVEDSVQVKKNDSKKNQTLFLPDGSTVWLSPNSSLTYSKANNTSSIRRVYLEGEAYFEVSRNTNHPFFVVADELVVKVLGTSFSVRSKQSNRLSQVMVRTGVVSVFTGNIVARSEINQLEGGTLVNRNEQVTIDKAKEIHKESVKQNDWNQFAHAGELLQFNATPVGEAFKTLEKLYGNDIEFDAALMKDCFITASFEDEPYLHKLNLICTAIGARFIKLENDTIKIISKGC